MAAVARSSTASRIAAAIFMLQICFVLSIDLYIKRIDVGTMAALMMAVLMIAVVAKGYCMPECVAQLIDSDSRTVGIPKMR